MTRLRQPKIAAMSGRLLHNLDGLSKYELFTVLQLCFTWIKCYSQAHSKGTNAKNIIKWSSCHNKCWYSLFDSIMLPLKVQQTRYYNSKGNSSLDKSRGPCVRKLLTGLIMYIYPLKIKNIVLYCKPLYIIKYFLKLMILFNINIFSSKCWSFTSSSAL